jgi:uncharacterized protein (DUF58 family)
MLAAGTQRIQSLVAQWAKRRQGDDASSVTLQRRRIYILPTRHGLVFAAMVFAMLLASLQYAASLAFAMTFLLAALGLVAMQHCHNNLLGMTVRFGGADAVFAGDEARFRLTLENSASQPRLDIAIEGTESKAGPIDLDPGASTTLHLDVPAARRGHVQLGRFAVATTHPGNLFRAWTWIHMDARCLVYPAPAAPGRAPPVASVRAGERAMQNREDDDFAGLRVATPSDPPKRLAWKAIARSDQLLVKEVAGGSEQPQIFEFEALRNLDVEARLSQLTRWCLDAAETGAAFGLVLPQETIALGSGERHLHRCLRALALFGEPS